MLDQLPIGEPEPKHPLKCELCGLDIEYHEELHNEWDWVDETGVCYTCDALRAERNNYK